MKRRLELQQGLHPLLRAHEVAAAGVHHRATATHTGVDDAPLPRHRQELQHPIAVLLRARAQRRPVHPGRPAGQLLHRAAKGRLPGPAALRRPQQEGKGAHARALQRPRRAPAAGAETSATNGPLCAPFRAPSTAAAAGRGDVELEDRLPARSAQGLGIPGHRGVRGVEAKRLLPRMQNPPKAMQSLQESSRITSFPGSSMPYQPSAKLQSLQSLLRCLRN